MLPATVSMNISASIGNTISALITAAMGITLTNFDHLWQLTLLSSLSTLLPLVLVPLLPRYINKVRRLGPANRLRWIV